MLDLIPEQLTEVRCILAQHMPNRTVRAFGSRTTGTAKPFSDLDLVIMGETPLDFRQLAALKDAFVESNLPFRVDVVDWATTSNEFRAIIERQYELIASY